MRVVIVGAGHNGLVASFYLAREGLSVEIIEANAEVGGACKTEELVPGYRFSTCANLAMFLRPKVLADLDLVGRGVEIGGALPRTRILEGGRPFVWWPEESKLHEEISRFSRQDADSWSSWMQFWRDCANLLGPYLLDYPPTLQQLFADAQSQDKSELLSTLLTSSMVELADRFFVSPEMRSSIMASPDTGTLYDHGSALTQALQGAMTMYTETGDPVPFGYAKGGMGQVTQAMAAAAESVGVKIRTASPVRRIVVDGDHVAGVELETGEQVEADIVVSNADLKRTFGSLLADCEALASLRTKVANLRTDIAGMKMHFALTELPEFPAFGDSDIATRGPLTLCTNREQSERAWDDAINGRLPTEPIMIMMTPSTWDTSLAPPGHHTMSIWLLYAPVKLAESSWREQHGQMEVRIIGQNAEHSPNFRKALVDHVLFTPEDIEERVLLTNGNIHHIDISASQMLWQRPLPELARYRAPIGGLYLCGAGQHPYGEVSGAPGHNAAHAILEDLEIIQSWGQSTNPHPGQVSASTLSLT
jgi:phytoene dehydrogenase-like protein